MMTLWSGREVDPLRVQPDDLELGDIAHALALTTRYGGHTFGHLSVARHSLIVAALLPTRLLQRCGLFHDAAEAILGDIPTGLKHSPVFDDYRRLEHHLERVIAARFDLPHPMPVLVKYADEQAAQQEMAPGGLRWSHDGDWRIDEAEWLEAAMGL